MKIEKPSKLIVFSGAGLSAESGIQTFRDADGLWCGYDPATVCYFPTWLENFTDVHAFYNARRVQLATVEPNAAHYALAELQAKYGEDRVELWTQNVDDLLERAGCTKVNHVHGFLTEVICTHCGVITDIGHTELNNPERCDKCGNGPMKPRVVFFGETAPMYGHLYPAMKRAIKNRRNTVVVIGSSGNVIPLEGLGIRRRSIFEAYKIYNGLDAGMNDLACFDACYLKPATDAFSKGLTKLLTDRLDGVFDDSMRRVFKTNVFRT